MTLPKAQTETPKLSREEIKAGMEVIDKLVTRTIVIDAIGAAMAALNENFPANPYRRSIVQHAELFQTGARDARETVRKLSNWLHDEHLKTADSDFARLMDATDAELLARAKSEGIDPLQVADHWRRVVDRVTGCSK